MSVIVGRALPDIRDGQTGTSRVLYTMQGLGLNWNRAYKKAARVIGDSWASTIRTATRRSTRRWCAWCRSSRCAIRWSTGRGTTGPRRRRSAGGHALHRGAAGQDRPRDAGDIDRDTVDFVPNFDESERGRSFLPTRIPNLLINGSSGIAVGMATNIRRTTSRRSSTAS